MAGLVMKNFLLLWKGDDLLYAIHRFGGGSHIT